MRTLTTSEPAEVRPSPGDRIEEATLKLLSYCRGEDWSGYDPYDALNSPVFSALPVLNTKWPRLLFTQLLKRSPINFRSALQIPKTQNPKALALCLRALLKLRRLGLVDDESLLRDLASRIEATRSSSQYWCWGYSFPWQGRSVLVPRGEPNLVCTTFVAAALIDLFEETADARYLAMAESAGDYLLRELFWTDGKGIASFGYPTASAQSRVHNANFLAAAFLLRLYRHTGLAQARDVAMQAAAYSVGCQRPDGSWPYGELANQHWIDNFHTGFNLCALRRIAQCGETNDFNQSIDRGYRFYVEHFFREDGAPRYFHNHTYPIDSHSVAQGAITLLRFTDQDSLAMKRARDVLIFALDNLRDEEGYFYFQKTTWGTITISYMRWTQAWMLLALATFLEKKNLEANRAI